MNRAGSTSFLKRTPSWFLAVLTLVVAFVVLFAVGESARESDQLGYLAYALHILIIGSGCFFIVRANPKSVWYVPFICNATSIIAAFVEPNFWHTSIWIPNLIAWGVTIIVTFIARRIGKRLLLRRPATARETER